MWINCWYLVLLWGLPMTCSFVLMMHLRLCIAPYQTRLSVWNSFVLPLPSPLLVSPWANAWWISLSTNHGFLPRKGERFDGSFLHCVFVSCHYIVVCEWNVLTLPGIFKPYFHNYMDFLSLIMSIALDFSSLQLQKSFSNLFTEHFVKL